MLKNNLLTLFILLLAQPLLFAGSVKNTASSSDLKSIGRCFMISIGVNEYPYLIQKYPGLSFLNCEEDAKEIDRFFKWYYFQGQEPTDLEKKRYRSYQLYSKNATKENIIAAINDVINSTEPNDFFIFNFSGASNLEQEEPITFYPYINPNQQNSNSMKENAISLEMLKDLIELIPANNQLIITEAGNANDIGRKLVKTLLEGTNSIKHLSKKNRVIITPKNIGLDGINCKTGKKQGPINCFITSLPLSQNIFGIFKNSKNLNHWDAKDAKEIENAILQNESEARLKEYTSIFFERQLLDDLEYYIPEQNLPSRGAQSINLKTFQNNKNTSSKKHALLIGVSHYESSTQWNSLINPKIDVEAIAKMLKNDYNYYVKLLINPKH